MFHLHWTTHDNTKGGILGRDNVLGQVWDLFDMYIGCKHLRWENEPRLMDSVGEDRRSGRDRKNAWGHYSSSLASVIIITILIIISTWRFVLSNYFNYFFNEYRVTERNVYCAEHYQCKKGVYCKS